MRGTSAAVVPVDDVVELLAWSPEGGRLCALSARSATVVDMAQGGAVAVFHNPGASGLMRVSLSAAAFLREGDVLLGDGKGELRALEFRAAAAPGPALAEACTLPADEQRVRVKAIACNHRGAGAAVTFVVGTSSGRVEVWLCKAPASTASLRLEHFVRVHVVETAVRLTCLAFWSGAGASAAKAADPLAAAMDELADLKRAVEDLAEAE